jgi:hypothetical protein
MRLFFIGSLPEVDDSANALTADQARASLQAIGAEVAANGHQLIVCSPFPGSADLEVVRQRRP